MALAGTVMENFPSALVEVPVLVPFTCTVTSDREVSPELTRPVTVVWANDEKDKREVVSIH